MSTSTLFSTAVATMDADAANIATLFGDGNAVAQRRRALDPARLLEAERFVEQIAKGLRPLHHFQEAMSRSDFPLYFADSLDRQLYGSYTATTATWKNYARAATVNDFRPVKRFATTGVRGILTEVKELEEHKRRTQTLSEFEYSVKKFEAGFGFSFEMMISDDLDMFMRMPQDLADSAIDSEERFVATLIADSTGPNATYYTSGNANLMTGNPPLTRAALQAAITQLMERTDDNGNPIQISSVELVVGPGLALTAAEILDATEYRSVGPDGNVTIIRGNGVAGNLRTNVNYWIPSVVTGGNAATSWWLFANPNQGRPALEVGRLRGYEAPALYERVPDMKRIGGGTVPWSYDHGAAEKKIVHVFGGSFIDTRMTVASQGDGS